MGLPAGDVEAPTFSDRLEYDLRLMASADGGLSASLSTVETSLPSLTAEVKEHGKIHTRQVHSMVAHEQKHLRVIMAK
jgi:hypothetical protein